MANEQYRSVEQRVWDVSKPVRDGLWRATVSLVKSSDAVLLAPLRIPTAIRRNTYKQGYWHKKVEGIPESIGGVIGIIGSSVFDVYGVAGVIKETIDGNYAPLIAIGATNLLSLAYEIGSAVERKKLKNIEAKVVSSAVNADVPFTQN